MTDLLTEAEAAEPSLPRRRWLVGAGALGVVALLIAGWWGLAAHQRSRVVVWFDARPVECLDQVPAIIDLELDFDPLFVTAVEAAPGLDCGLRVWVENRGWLGAKLGGLELTYYGPSTGAGIRATTLSPLGVEPAVEDAPGLPARDARYAFDYPLEAGGALMLSIRLEHAPDGCLTPDSLAWVPDAPALDVAVLGLRGTRAPVGVAFVQRGTEESSCDSP
jgi:hypothetical protein